MEGVLHLKHSIQLVRDGTLNRDRLKQASAEPYFVPENTSLRVQLSNFQKQRRELGFVVDEYGAVSGIVTLEDILEEIVGELGDTPAQDESEGLPLPLPGGAYLISGRSSLREINRNLGWNLPAEGPKTLNGLVTEHLEALPKSNTCTTIQGYRIEIVSTRGKIIEKARVLPPEQLQRPSPG